MREAHLPRVIFTRQVTVAVEEKSA
jgi:hypothetical protein